MSMSRENILNRLKNSPQKKRRQNRTKLEHGLFLDQAGKSPEDNGETLLIEKLTENKIEVYQSSDWLMDMIAAGREKQIQSWLIGQGLPYHEQVSCSLEKHIPNVKITRYTQTYENLKTQLFHQVGASITLAKSAIADTGTLLIIPDEHEPRMMSLIPPIHFIVLDKKDIYPDFQTLINTPGWYSENNASSELPSNILFISSPSKTADIQQTIAYGAHGPKEVIVLLK